MISSVKIYGAGSIGNHLAQASRRIGWSVCITDVDNDALLRTKNEIYPGRYGSWDEEIKLMHADIEDNSTYDLVIIGTPPDTHLQLSIEALKHRPKAILIEKPATALDMTDADNLLSMAINSGTRLFVGYDHVVSEGVKALSNLIIDDEIQIETIDAEFREYWGGIFAAHPWLAGPWESYLGFSERGGGALAEHSHALNLWQHLARISGAGRIVEVQAMTDTVYDSLVNYDKISALTVKTESGLLGRCIQDVITSPPRTWVGVKSKTKQFDLYFSPSQDRLVISLDETELKFEKSRPDDFYVELKHIEECIENDLRSPIDFIHGLETMLVVKAAHLSAKLKCNIAINYELGFNDKALNWETRNV